MIQIEKVALPISGKGKANANDARGTEAVIPMNINTADPCFINRIREIFQDKLMLIYSNGKNGFGQQISPGLRSKPKKHKNPSIIKLGIWKIVTDEESPGIAAMGTKMNDHIN